MSRLCRLRTKSHGPDGQWAYDEITSLRAQLKEAQEAAEFNFRQYQDVGRLLCEAHEQLAASQAREQQLREALCELKDLMDDVEKGYYRPDSFTTQPAREALAIPSDTAALEALIAKAGEVMRERCACIRYDEKLEGSIRALPNVTLEDLK